MKGNVIGKLTNHHGVLLSLIVLVVFTGTLLHFSSGGQPASQSAQIGADDFRSEISVLDNDMDNDGYPDGTANPLAMLGLDLVAVVGVVLPLAPLVGGRLLLVVDEPPRVFSVWGLVLERPG